jgi:dihydrofolate reductase/thymidylate synthase
MENSAQIFVINQEENQYINLLKELLGKSKESKIREDRTKVGTISTFGCIMKFNLSKSFPLLTTKKVFWKGIIEELLWFIKGDTNTKHLEEKGVNIWHGNTTRKYLDSVGLEKYEEFDAGPIYGFQWRHFGAEYTGMQENYNEKGIDQLMECVKLIKENPSSRRIIMTAWNPCDIKKMALPPCHMICQFYVDKLDQKTPELCCAMNQRSCDMGLGVPYNIASYSLLTNMIAHSCGLGVGEFIYFMGDVHIYFNHIEALSTQTEREPRNFPQIKFLCPPKEITEYTYQDIEIVGYNPHPAIKMEMAV